MVKTFNQTLTSVLKHSWIVESGFDYGKGPLVVKANGTGVLMEDDSTPEVSNDQSWDVDLATDKEQSYNRTEWANFSSVVYTIPPMKTTTLEWTISSCTQEVPWTSVVTVGGFFAVWFKTKVNGNNLWFCPVTVLEDPLLEHVRPEELEFVARGRYEGVRTIETPAKVAPAPEYGGPQNVSTVAPPDVYDYAEVQLPPTGKPEAKRCEVAQSDAVPAQSGAVSFRNRSPVLYILLATNLLTMTVHVFP
ncbi:hypothetical protein IscW_ISCW024160 [Ixodes scapularis]|uniref:Uncharacterized protein n=1 Tax=Ixodes scapularis TaxID=6945 RepID=B7P7X2_IXOSC|nr:hypothetical protein IscW_ISCW024160 [Ixodes scapularis]|eukprot:XP_002400078.1 hypothetical protein IscW_ISCW024160 [Ixodes scapularis]